MGGAGGGGVCEWVEGTCQSLIFRLFHAMHFFF